MDFILKMMDFEGETSGGVSRLGYAASPLTRNENVSFEFQEIMDFIFKMMDFAFKMMDFAFKMMDFAIK